MPIEFKYEGEDYVYTITVYEEETEYFPEEDEDEDEEDDGVTCPICGRKFASPGNLKQHRTVKEH